MRASRLFSFLLIALFGAVASAIALLLGYGPARYLAILFVLAGAIGVAVGLVLRVNGQLVDDVTKKSRD